MTEADVRNLLEQFNDQSLQLLGRAQLERLGKDLTRHLALLQREEVLAEIATFYAELPGAAKKIFEAHLKQANVRKPAKSASPDQLRAHLQQLRKVWDRTKAEIGGYTAELQGLKKADEESALSRIAGYDAAQRKALSMLAGFTKLTPKGSAPLNLSASANNNRQWLAELRKKMPGDILSITS